MNKEKEALKLALDIKNFHLRCGHSEESLAKTLSTHKNALTDFYVNRLLRVTAAADPCRRQEEAS